MHKHTPPAHPSVKKSMPPLPLDPNVFAEKSSVQSPRPASTPRPAVEKKEKSEKLKTTSSKKEATSKVAKSGMDATKKAEIFSMFVFKKAVEKLVQDLFSNEDFKNAIENDETDKLDAHLKPTPFYQMLKDLRNKGIFDLDTIIMVIKKIDVSVEELNLPKSISKRQIYRVFGLCVKALQRNHSDNPKQLIQDWSVGDTQKLFIALALAGEGEWSKKLRKLLHALAFTDEESLKFIDPMTFKLQFRPIKEILRRAGALKHINKLEALDEKTKNQLVEQGAGYFSGFFSTLGISNKLMGSDFLQKIPAEQIKAAQSVRKNVVVLKKLLLREICASQLELLDAVREDQPDVTTVVDNTCHLIINSDKVGNLPREDLTYRLTSYKGKWTLEYFAVLGKDAKVIKIKNVPQLKDALSEKKLDHTKIRQLIQQYHLKTMLESGRLKYQIQAVIHPQSNQELSFVISDDSNSKKDALRKTEEQDESDTEEKHDRFVYRIMQIVENSTCKADDVIDVNNLDKYKVVKFFLSNQSYEGCLIEAERDIREQILEFALTRASNPKIHPALWVENKEIIPVEVHSEVTRTLNNDSMGTMITRYIKTRKEKERKKLEKKQEKDQKKLEKKTKPEKESYQDEIDMDESSDENPEKTEDILGKEKLMSTVQAKEDEPEKKEEETITIAASAKGKKTQKLEVNKRKYELLKKIISELLIGPGNIYGAQYSTAKEEDIVTSKKQGELARRTYKIITENKEASEGFKQYDGSQRLLMFQDPEEVKAIIKAEEQGVQKGKYKSVTDLRLNEAFFLLGLAVQDGNSAIAEIENNTQAALQWIKIIYQLLLDAMSDKIDFTRLGNIVRYYIDDEDKVTKIIRRISSEVKPEDKNPKAKVATSILKYVFNINATIINQAVEVKSNREAALAAHKTLGIDEAAKFGELFTAVAKKISSNQTAETQSNLETDKSAFEKLKNEEATKFSKLFSALAERIKTRNANEKVALQGIRILYNLLRDVIGFNIDIERLDYILRHHLNDESKVRQLIEDISSETHHKEKTKKDYVAKLILQQLLKIDLTIINQAIGAQSSPEEDLEALKVLKIEDEVKDLKDGSDFNESYIKLEEKILVRKENEELVSRAIKVIYDLLLDVMHDKIDTKRLSYIIGHYIPDEDKVKSLMRHVTQLASTEDKDKKTKIAKQILQTLLIVETTTINNAIEKQLDDKKYRATLQQLKIESAAEKIKEVNRFRSLFNALEQSIKARDAAIVSKENNDVVLEHLYHIIYKGVIRVLKNNSNADCIKILTQTINTLFELLPPDLNASSQALKQPLLNWIDTKIRQRTVSKETRANSKDKLFNHIFAVTFIQELFKQNLFKKDDDTLISLVGMNKNLLEALLDSLKAMDPRPSSSSAEITLNPGKSKLSFMSPPQSSAPQPSPDSPKKSTVEAKPVQSVTLSSDSEEKSKHNDSSRFFSASKPKSQRSVRPGAANAGHRVSAEMTSGAIQHSSEDEVATRSTSSSGSKHTHEVQPSDDSTKKSYSSTAPALVSS